MGVFDTVFNTKNKDITSRDLKIALTRAKLDRKKKQIELRKLSKRNETTLGRLKQARRLGNNDDVNLLYDEMKGLRYETQMARQDLKVLNLESVGLSRYLRGVERLEKTGNKAKVRELIEKVSTSGLETKLRSGEVDEAAYIDMLNSHMEELGLEVDEMESNASEDDDEKKNFLSQLDALIAAEEGGDMDLVEKEEAALKGKIENNEVA